MGLFLKYLHHKLDMRVSSGSLVRPSDSCSLQTYCSRHFIISLYTETSLKLKKDVWLRYVQTGLSFKISTFCPHSVFMCFVWVWEQTAIISLYSINWLVCITETECVYCGVRTGSLYIILRSAHTVYLCVLCGSENKQQLFPYTALTDWFL